MKIKSSREMAKTKRNTYQAQRPKRGETAKKNLEKQQQTATNSGAWKRSGTELEIAIGFGSRQDCQRVEKLADDFLKLKSKRRSLYSRRSEAVLLNLRN
jgi:hypothetical protein